MIYRKLGRTGIDVGVVGLGAEYLEHAPLETVTSVVDVLIDRGINYIDLFMASPAVRDNFGQALAGKRQRVVIAGHLGAIMQDGQYCRSRDGQLSVKYFEDLLTRLRTDYIDVLMLHYIDETDDYDNVFGPGGLLEIAERLTKEGKARAIGMSSHCVPVSLKAVQSGCIDALLFPVNPAFDTLPGDTKVESLIYDGSYRREDETSEKFIAQRQEFYQTCARYGVGIVVMKPYAAGLLFAPENPSGIVLTPVQCLSYALAQPGVSTVVPGCKNVAEMEAALAFLEATEAEKDFSAIDVNSAWKLQGSCMYCNHCLPCPVGIDIAATTRILDTAGDSPDEKTAAEYAALTVNAAACTECGECETRCPFGVEIIANMTRATAVFRQ